ncbi:hypothetical protein MPSEU_000402700 [Mayamaea pseudoterrestris]|nr:hypothetical protein MPSEU_000402700 [Mayamaea pseudoterrestris]
MKIFLALLALLCLSVKGFAPASVPRPSLVSLQAQTDSSNDLSFLSKRIVATTAATMLSIGLLMGGDVMPAMAATKTAPVVEQVAAAKPKKQPAAPVAPEKKAVDTARAAVDAANAKIAAANKEGAAAKAANDKATVLLKKCEAAVVQAKSQYLNENDKLTKAKGKNANTNFIVQEQQKVADLKEAERISQIQLQNAKLTKKNAATRLGQADSNLKAATKQREQAQKNFQNVEKKYQKYLAEKTKQEKVQMKRQKEQEAAKRKEEQKQKAIAAEKAKKEAAEKALRLKQEEAKIKELQAARDKALQLQQESAKQAAANQAKLEAEVKTLAELKRNAK